MTFVTTQKVVATFLWVKAEIISTKVCVWVAQLMLLVEQMIVDSRSLKWKSFPQQSHPQNRMIDSMLLLRTENVPLIKLQDCSETMIKFIPVMNATIFVTIQKDVPTFLWVKAISTKVCVWVAQLMLLVEQMIVDSRSLKWKSFPQQSHPQNRMIDSMLLPRAQPAGADDCKGSGRRSSFPVRRECCEP